MADNMMPDLSHLSEEERKIIEEVLQRQKAEEDKEQQTANQAERELEDVERQIAERVEKAQRLIGTQDDAICQICQKTKFADGIGHKCHYCQLRSCARCGGRAQIKTKVEGSKLPTAKSAQQHTRSIWACSLCQKKQNILARTGKWFHAADGKQTTPDRTAPSTPTSITSSGAPHSPLPGPGSQPRPREAQPQSQPLAAMNKSGIAQSDERRGQGPSQQQRQQAPSSGDQRPRDQQERRPSVSQSRSSTSIDTRQQNGPSQMSPSKERSRDNRGQPEPGSQRQPNGPSQPPPQEQRRRGSYSSRGEAPPQQRTGPSPEQQLDARVPHPSEQQRLSQQRDHPDDVRQSIPQQRPPQSDRQQPAPGPVRKDSSGRRPHEQAPLPPANADNRRSGSDHRSRSPPVAAGASERDRRGGEGYSRDYQDHDARGRDGRHRKEGQEDLAAVAARDRSPYDNVDRPYSPPYNGTHPRNHEEAAYRRADRDRDQRQPLGGARESSFRTDRARSPPHAQPLTNKQPYPDDRQRYEGRDKFEQEQRPPSPGYSGSPGRRGSGDRQVTRGDRDVTDRRPSWSQDDLRTRPEDPGYHHGRGNMPPQQQPADSRYGESAAEGQRNMRDSRYRSASPERGFQRSPPSERLPSDREPQRFRQEGEAHYRDLSHPRPPPEHRISAPPGVLSSASERRVESPIRQRQSSYATVPRSSTYRTGEIPPEALPDRARPPREPAYNERRQMPEDFSDRERRRIPNNVAAGAMPSGSAGKQANVPPHVNANAVPNAGASRRSWKTDSLSSTERSGPSASEAGIGRHHHVPAGHQPPLHYSHVKPPQPHKHKRPPKIARQQRSYSSSDDEIRSTPECSCEDVDIESESFSEKGGFLHSVLRESGLTNHCLPNSTSPGDLEKRAARYLSGDVNHLKHALPAQTPVTWQPSIDGTRMIGHMILHKHAGGRATTGDSSSVLGLKVVGGRRLTETGRMCAFVTKVKKGSIADVVGRLRPGDEVLEWNGRQLQDASYEQVYDIINESKYDSQVELIVSRSTVILDPGSLDLKPSAKLAGRFAKAVFGICFKSERPNSNLNLRFADLRSTQDGSHSANEDERMTSTYGVSDGDVQQSSPTTTDGFSPQPRRSVPLSVLFCCPFSSASAPLSHDHEAHQQQHRQPGSESVIYRQPVPVTIMPSQTITGAPGPPVVMITGPHDPNNVAALAQMAASSMAPAQQQQLQQQLQQHQLQQHQQQQQAMQQFAPVMPSKVSPAQGQIFGNLQVSLYYDQLEGQLMITVYNAVELAPRADGTLRNPYIKMFLLPDRSERSKRKSRTLVNTCHPLWNQTFVYPGIRKRDLQGRMLEITLWDYDRYATNEFLGETLIDLAVAPLDNEPRWYMLTDMDDDSEPRARLRMQRLSGASHSTAPEYMGPASTSGFSSSAPYDSPYENFDIGSFTDASRSPRSNSAGYRKEPSGSRTTSLPRSRTYGHPKTRHPMAVSQDDAETFETGYYSDHGHRRDRPPGTYSVRVDQRGQHHARQQMSPTEDRRPPGVDAKRQLPQIPSDLYGEQAMRELGDKVNHIRTRGSLAAQPLRSHQSRRMHYRGGRLIDPHSPLHEGNLPGYLSDGSEVSSMSVTSTQSERPRTKTAQEFQSSLETAAEEGEDDGQEGGTMSDSAVGGSVASSSKRTVDEHGKRRKTTLMTRLIPGKTGSAQSVNERSASKRRTGFIRSEEVGVPSTLSPGTGPNLLKQASIESNASASSDSSWIPTIQPGEGPLGEFIKGLGPGQIAGRQVLASPILGEIQLSIYDRRGQLEVEVIRARGLMPKPGAKMTPAPYVKVYLHDGKYCIAKAKTAITRRTLEPYFQQQLLFDEDYKGKTLQLAVWGDYGRMERKAFMGISQIQLDLLNLVAEPVVNAWYKLFHSSSVHGMVSTASSPGRKENEASSMNT